MSDSLLLEREAHVVTLTLNRPDRLNALTADLLDELGAAWEALNADPEVRAVVLTGAGRGFCAGADLSGDRSPPAGADARGDAPVMPRFTARHRRVYKPVITAVNGVCAGAGLHFVADADIVIASEAATFLDTHVHVGQVSALEPIGLARRVPLGSVLRMVVLGRHERLAAGRAYEIGLVGEVVAPERLLPRAMELARMAASASPATLQASLRAIWEGLDRGLDEAIEHGWGFVWRHWSHPDCAEGPRAFMEKREPRWTE